MKKTMMFVVLSMITLLAMACQTEETNKIYSNNYGCCQQGNTESGVKIYLKANLAIGQLGWYAIDKNIDAESFTVSDGATVINQAVYPFNLEAGNYTLIINGFNFSDQITFEVVPGKYTEVVLDLNEWPYATMSSETYKYSPAGLTVPGPNHEIFIFSLDHDWNTPITPTEIGFHVALSGTAEVDNCNLKIAVFEGDTITWIPIGGPVSKIIYPNETGVNFIFSADDNTLETTSITSPIYPDSSNVYKLSCDIYGFMANFQAILNDMKTSSPDNIQVIMEKWAIGNTLSF